MPALILAHPSSPVKFDPPLNVDAALAARRQERLAAGYPPDDADSLPSNPYHPPSAADWERLEVYQGLENLILKMGATRVMTLVRNIAAMLGQECE